MDSRPRHDALWVEIRREQAAALGGAGKQLKSALDAYHRHIADGGKQGDPRTEELLTAVAQKVYALLLQREFVGFAQDNLDWLGSSFDLPPGIVARVGALATPGFLR